LTIASITYRFLSLILWSKDMTDVNMIQLSERLNAANKAIEQMRGALELETTRSQAASQLINEVTNANIQWRSGTLIAEKQLNKLINWLAA
jgi:hypothetical protein